MNLVRFISQRLHKNRKSSSKNKVHSIVQIAIASIAVSIMAMILSYSIVRGFQHEIRNKVIMFDAHIKIGKFDLYNSISEEPVSKNQTFMDQLKKDTRIQKIEFFAEKPGIIKTNDDVYGILLKGVDNTYSWDNIKKNIVYGSELDTLDKNSILIGYTLAQKLQLDTGSKVKVYFMQDPIRVRVFKVSGIYKSGMGQFDESIAYCSLSHIQKLNDWDSTMVGGFDIFLKKYSDIWTMDDFIYDYIGYDLNTLKIGDRYPEIFGWLNLLDTNVWVVLILATLVALVNMISTVLIMILDKTSAIGLLKILGLNNKMLRSIFFNLFFRIFMKGLWVGNILGIGLCVTQHYFKIFTLPEETYYISYVPISFEWQAWIFINILAWISCLLAFVLPSFIISNIKPAQTIKFN